jgi:27-O-demethylrifamycin SV methyltransferase
MVYADNPVAHYDKINRAWQYLLGEDFHYGYFRDDTEPLEAATGNLTALMAEKGSIGHDMSVLDVGCGIGNPACLLAARYRCRITGISTSREGVGLATRRAQDKGFSDRVSFLVADGMDNKLPPASFDRAWVMESSHLMPRKDALLAECSRVMRSGARLVLCDIMLRRELPLAEVLSRARDFIPLHYAFGHAKMETLDTYVQRAAHAGLQVTESIDISDQAFPTIAHWRRRLEANAAAVRAQIGDDGFEHFRSSCDVLERFWNERLFGYGLIVASKEKEEFRVQATR